MFEGGFSRAHIRGTLAAGPQRSETLSPSGAQRTRCYKNLVLKQMHNANLPATASTATSLLTQLAVSG